MQETFQFTSLPVVVIFLIADYLSSEEKANLSRVNKSLRELFNSPHPWKETTFCIKTSNRKKCQHVLDVLVQRKASSIKFDRSCSNDNVIKCILQGLPSLQSLAFADCSPNVLKHIHDFATNLRKLDLGEVLSTNFPNRPVRSISKWKLVFQDLKNLEKISIGPIVSVRQSVLMNEVQSALCCHGKLKSLVINGCDELVLTWIGEIFSCNPDLNSIGLRYIRHMSFGKAETEAGRKDLKKYCPSVQFLDLSGSLRGGRFLTWTLEWFNNLTSLTSLNLSQTMDERLLRLALQNLHKLTDLQRLDLTFSAVRDNMFVAKHSKLSWLELCGSFSLTSAGVLNISLAFGDTLKYLGLCNCYQINDNSMRDLPGKFPLLRELDVSGCLEISDSFLEDLYLRSSDLPLLRKLVVQGCRISSDMIARVREKTRNKVVVDKPTTCGNTWLMASIETQCEIDL